MRAFIVLLDHPFRVELCSSMTSVVNFEDKNPFVIITLKLKCQNVRRDIMFLASNSLHNLGGQK